MCGIILLQQRYRMRGPRPLSTKGGRREGLPSCFAIRPTTYYVLDIHDDSGVQLFSHDGNTIRAPTNVIGADWAAIF